MQTNKKRRERGLGFLSTLTLVLVVLKLAGVISWPWLWVFSPLWVPALLCAAAFGFILVGGRLVKGRW